MTHDDRPPPPMSLDYDRGSPPPNLVGKCFAAAALTTLLLVGGVFGWFVLVFALTYGKSDDRAKLMVVLSIVLGLAALVGLNVLAYRKYRDPRRRGLGMGIWIGLGVTLLIAGVCFGAV